MKKKILLLTSVLVLCSTCLVSGMDNAEDSTALFQAEETDGELSRDCYSVLTKYLHDEQVEQILFVGRTEGSRAVAQYHQKKNGTWFLVFTKDAFLGNEGIGEGSEYHARTPKGEWGITTAFGICENPGTALPYIDVTETTFACDENTEYYNCIIDIEETGHACNGEEMHSFSPEYDYGIATDYNSERIYPYGSNIFIHCNGTLPFTAGCIALDEEDMITILQTATLGMRVCIDEYSTLFPGEQ